MGVQLGAVTSDKSLLNKILSIVKVLYESNKKNVDSITVVHLKTTDSAYDYVNYEFPEYIVLSLNDKNIDTIKLLSIINNDPWFHSTGLIVIVDRSVEETIPDDLNKLNILSFIDITEIDYLLSRILEIILTNRQVAIQKDLANLILDKRSGSFIIDNDPSMVTSYVNIITSSLVNEKYINSSKETALRIALTELIMNGIEHGNCEISYQEKSKYLEEFGDINELIRKKNENPIISERKVYLNYTFTNDMLEFIIKDCGKGFNHKKKIYNPENEELLWKSHGRGIFMTKMYVDSLSYNDKGNEATIKMKTDRDQKTVPKGFLTQQELFFKPGDIVLKQSEGSNCLYYIVNGVYEIYRNGKKISELNPSDVFLGEMSFLLSNKRVADVIAKTEGRLIEIPKKDFIGIIKQYPHYGLFLSKLLAKRLDKINSNIS